MYIQVPNTQNIDLSDSAYLRFEILHHYSLTKY